MKVSIGVSARHIHLCEKDYKILCGDKKIVKVRDINQPGMFVSDDTFTIKTEKGEFNNVKLLGPLRSYSQVEISLTDAYKLGLNPPVRTSGDLKGSSPITIVGPCGEVNLDEGCIIADRHIHLTKEMKEYYGLKGDKVSVLVPGIKGGVMHNVDLKISDEAYFEMHIDLDDANAFMLKQGDIVDIID